MHGPAMPGWLLVALCLWTGAVCLARTRSCTGAGRRAAVDEAVMGVGMAAMAVPASAAGPPQWVWTGYAVVFGAAALRALWSVRGGAGHHLHHLVGSLAMVYMALAMTGGGTGPHTAHGGAAGAGAGGGVPLVTGALLVYYAVYVLRSGLRLVPAPAGTTGTAGTGTAGTGTAGTVPGGRWSGPETAPACRVAMGLAMLAMLAMLAAV
ncbi:DUF5134 domain-containing protein [Streptomyces sp. NPDC016309]|uniref:DUF5134 domain-containing protein n=1 Tax=Streptomyces sp. NPDC016309 TaxID=3364965 RepID=UPI0036FEB16E